MSCSTCHEVHAKDDPLADLQQQRNQCATCHMVQITRHEEFADSGVDFERITCSTCHDVHQLTVRTAGRRR